MAAGTLLSTVDLLLLAWLQVSGNLMTSLILPEVIELQTAGA